MDVKWISSLSFVRVPLKTFGLRLAPSRWSFLPAIVPPVKLTISAVNAALVANPDPLVLLVRTVFLASLVLLAFLVFPARPQFSPAYNKTPRLASPAMLVPLVHPVLLARLAMLVFLVFLVSMVLPVPLANLARKVLLVLLVSMVNLVFLAPMVLPLLALASTLALLVPPVLLVLPALLVLLVRPATMVLPVSPVPRVPPAPTATLATKVNLVPLAKLVLLVSLARRVFAPSTVLSMVAFSSRMDLDVKKSTSPYINTPHLLPTRNLSHCH